LTVLKNSYEDHAVKSEKNPVDNFNKISKLKTKLNFLPRKQMSALVRVKIAIK
jgi:hypothetical protein